MSQPLFANRAEAGRALAARLSNLAGQPDVIVLGLPRGGVVVAAEVARELRAPLDALSVRKVGVPWQSELAVGAVATGGIRVINQEVARHARLSQADLERAMEREESEVARRDRMWRGTDQPLALAGRTVILVDDGLATGATARAAARVARQAGANRVILAVPVAPGDTLDDLRSEVDATVALATPEPFVAVGAWYEDFGQTTDDQVRALLAAS